MNCTSARFVLASIQPNSPDSDVPEFAAELAHVRECPECQAYRTQLLQSDQELAVAIRNVSLPAGFKSRMLQRVQAATVQTTDLQLPVAMKDAAANSSSELELSVAVPSTVAAAGRAPLLEKAGGLVLSNTSTVPNVTVLNTTVPVTMRTILEDQGVPGRNATSKPRMNRRKLLGMASVSAAGVLGLGLWLFARRERPKLLIGDILAMCQSFSKAESGPFENSFQLELPTATFHFSRELQVSNATSFHQPGLGHAGREIGAAFSFTITNSRRVSVPAHLFVIDLQRIEVPGVNRLAPDFVSADVQYPLPNKYPTRVWSDGNRLYVCYAESADSTDLELLLPRLSHA
jgi:hypothetical protein